MKKWLKYIITPILLFICLGANNVKASSATCTYKMRDAIFLQCDASSDKTNLTCKLFSDTDSGNYSISHGYFSIGTNNLTNVSFQNISENKWECAPKIYFSTSLIGPYKAETKFTNISIEGTGNNDLSSADLVEDKSSYGDLISEIKEDIKYCKYGHFILAINNTTKEAYSANENTCSLAISYSDIQNENIIKDNDGCPLKIYAMSNAYGCGYSINSMIGYASIELNGTDPIFDANGEDANGNEENIIDKDYFNSCEDAGETINLLNKIYTLLRYLIPVLVIGLSIVDFIKVVVSGDEKAYKNAWNKFIKRVIIGVVILILPALLSLLIRISGVLETYEISEQNIFCIFK